MREGLIKQYYQMWIDKNRAGLDDIFSDEIYYSESFGPEYQGLTQVKKWFDDWTAKGTVLEWTVTQYIEKENLSIVEWYFACEYNDSVDAINGVSLIEWNEENKMVSVKEFQSKAMHYTPYN